MKSKIAEHLLSIIFVSALLLVALIYINRNSAKAERREVVDIQTYINLPFVDYSDPFHRALLKDVMNIYHPGQYDANKLLVDRIIRYHERQFSRNLQQANVRETFTAAKFRELLWMYAKFLLVYGLVMALTYYGVQTLGVWMFVRRKRNAFLDAAGRKTAAKIILNALSAVGKGVAYFVLFSPAYVIAYSIRTQFNTDTVVFMILLGVISNGLLIMYANKFYTFLKAESRKGYVETAVVKNLHNAYDQHGRDGISWRAIVKPFKRFDGHVFGHIFANAQFQYFASIKEQAAFLITGLIIIEMALNIHGHLSYEMLRQILYKNYDIVIAIILGIFYTVKMTEIGVDVLVYRQAMRYENRAA